MRIVMKQFMFAMASATVLLAGCGGSGTEDTSEGSDAVEIDRNPYPSTYAPYPSTTVLIKDAMVLDGIGGEISGGDVLLVDGKVSEVAEDIAAPGLDRTVGLATSAPVYTRPEAKEEATAKG